MLNYGSSLLRNNVCIIASGLMVVNLLACKQTFDGDQFSKGLEPELNWLNENPNLIGLGSKSDKLIQQVVACCLQYQVFLWP